MVGIEKLYYNYFKFFKSFIKQMIDFLRFRCYTLSMDKNENVQNHFMI